MLTYVSGNLLDDEAEALVNTVNCVGVMGKGIALQFKRKFPANFDAYAKACKRGDVSLGKMFTFELSSLVGPRWIVNFPTKGHWKSQSRLDDIRAGLDSLADFVKTKEISSIAIPPLGAGNGGLQWTDVRPLIEEFARGINAEVRVYAPSSGSRSVDSMEINMTVGRALLVNLITEYAHMKAELEPWEDANSASALEVQKLMYFASLGSADLKLRFHKFHYGPYSDPLRHQLQNMEGQFLVGYGDGTNRVLDFEPISPTPEGIKKSKSFIASNPRYQDQIESLVDNVINLIEGFASPYGLELLATVHWSATSTRSQDVAKIREDIMEWSARKGRMFTEAHVRKALDRLKESQLVPA
ncbi:macro domain-containing protein [Arthrobacter sp. AK04]|uniref:type II toxin-antitoxin system antitoxin DNA ADP-ribosyl glycohydrolase DarG n=1 Tax=Arthrobacter sp. AK04 TaxID=2900048 RepID=UPI001E512F43|nr:macro domain-containing protein [Arthrobacter sp. AK04]MCD5341446.1 macro domain-containing protein [Arthrobacter sp. AK04]